MTKNTASPVVAIALAALMALSMLAATNALAGHQYRVASKAHLVVLGQRVAQL